MSLKGLTLVFVIEYYVCKRISAERVHWEYIDSGLKSTTTLAFCDSSSDFLCFGGWRGQCIGSCSMCVPGGQSMPCTICASVLHNVL